MADELVDIVNEVNQVLHQTSKSHAHQHGLLHRTVIGEVRDPNGNIVLVKQASDRQDAGQYVSPVGGHAKAGESEEAALRREALEEIGLVEFNSELVGRFVFNRQILGRQENHYFIVYRITADPSEFVLGPEAVGHRTFEPLELQSLLKTQPELFGAALFAVLSQFYPELLA